ncbi:MAG: hypothetical protein CM1200mP20_15440 [Pseudomonadota bacterium]|nr:MAG: hypothetical protein CM1200mP20_15440 [Pseudomonadota bacterium]
MPEWEEERAFLQSLSRRSGLVLLYHGLFGSVPKDLEQGLHNVCPDALYRQLDTIGRFFRFVTIDEYCLSADRIGLATVTSDDGYRSVIEEGLPVFEALDVPAALFINRDFVCGGVFWRDKVRFLINNNLVETFEQSHGREFVRDTGQVFYHYTKDFRNNSCQVETAIDDFLADHGIELDLQKTYVSQGEFAEHHPLLCFGSHTVSHYVLASLSPEEQARQIEENLEFLRSQSGLTVTDVLSIPFGEQQDYNRATVALAREIGHSALLLSEGRLDVSTAYAGTSLKAIGRIMPRENGFMATLIKADYKTVRSFH